MSIYPRFQWQPPTPKWTWARLRYHAQAYLGVERLPSGLRAELRPLLGRPTVSEPITSILRRYRKPPWVL